MIKNIGLIGAGKWGSNYLAIDIPGLKITPLNRANWRQSVSCGSYDAFIVATPPNSHLEISEYCLKLGFPVLIEKPLSLSLEDCEKISLYNSCNILVNNIHIFNSNMLRLKELVMEEGLVEITSSGYNNGPFRDYSDLWDYGWHEIGIGLFLSGQLNHSHISSYEIVDGLHLVNINYGNVKHNTIFGNRAPKKKRKISILTKNNNTYFYDEISGKSNIPGYVNENTLENVVKYFIYGQKDIRAGLNINLSIAKILDGLEKYEK